MALNLVKGSSLPITKEDNTPLKKVRVNLSWNPNESKSQHAFDLDVMSAVCKNEALQAIGESHIAFFNQKNTPAIIVSPDSLTGDAAGVDEFLIINLEAAVAAGATHIPVLVTIYGASRKGQNFSMVDGATVELVDESTGTVLGSCNITEQGSSTDESLLVGVFEKQADGTFKYNQTNEFFDKSFEEWLSLINS